MDTNTTFYVVCGLLAAFFALGMGVGTYQEKERAQRLRWPRNRRSL